MMDEERDEREGMRIDIGFKELEVVAYMGDFRIVGIAHFGVGHRTSSRRASDYIKAFSESRLTLSNVRISSRDNQKVVDTAPFIILNMDKVDFLYARDEKEETTENEGGARQ